MFLLKGLRGVGFVSVVYAGVTGTSLREIGDFGKIGVDSIGFAEGDVADRGSADSTGLTAESGVWGSDKFGTPPTPGGS